MSTTRLAARSPLLVRSLTVGLLILGLATFGSSLRWRGARFPGFFVMPNRVVPSAALPGWSGVRDGRPLYQQVLLAVDGEPVGSGAEGYARAASREVGASVEYVFARNGTSEPRAFPLRIFGHGEWVAIFGMYFVTGLAYLLLAVVAGERWNASPLFRGLAAFGWVSAAFAFTGMDIYGPGRLFRLHALAESLLPVAAAHLALVCPRDRLGGRRGLLAAVYGIGLALAAAYEMFLYEPRAYSAIHNLAQALGVGPVLVLTIGLGLGASDPPAALGGSGVRRLLGGALVGIVLPAAVLGISGASGGVVPVNVTAWVGFAFPIACIAALRALPAGPESPPLATASA